MNMSKFFIIPLILFLLPTNVWSQNATKLPDNVAIIDVNLGDTILVEHTFINTDCGYFDNFVYNGPPPGYSDYSVYWKKLNGGIDVTMYYIPTSPGIHSLYFKGTAILHERQRACYDKEIIISSTFNVHSNSKELFFQQRYVIYPRLDTSRKLLLGTCTFLGHNPTNDTLHIDSIRFSHPTDQYNYLMIDTSNTKLSPEYLIPGVDWVNIPIIYTSNYTKSSGETIKVFLFSSTKSSYRVDTLSVEIGGVYFPTSTFFNVSKIDLVIPPGNHIDTSFSVSRSSIAEILSMDVSSPSITILAIDSLKPLKVHIRITAKDSTVLREDMLFRVKSSLSLLGNPNFRIDSNALNISYKIPLGSVAKLFDASEQVEIFPNPTSGNASIFNRGNSTISIRSIRFFNRLGSEVLSMNTPLSLPPNESLLLRTDKLSNGEYIIQIDGGASPVLKKMLLLR